MKRKQLDGKIIDNTQSDRAVPLSFDDKLLMLAAGTGSQEDKKRKMKIANFVERAGVKTDFMFLVSSLLPQINLLLKFRAADSGVIVLKRIWNSLFLVYSGDVISSDAGLQAEIETALDDFEQEIDGPKRAP